jgi:hypothetical protein
MTPTMTPRIPKNIQRKILRINVQASRRAAV